MLRADGLLHAMGSSTNYKILRVLCASELCACKLPALIGCTQSNTSMHLAKLSKLGVIASRREGKKVIYSLKDARVQRVFSALEVKR